MPYDEPEAGDPQLLVGVSLPGDEAATRAMAAAFADELAQMGFERERLLEVFASPFYAGAHAARQLLGEAEIACIVDDSLRVYGGRRYMVVDADTDDGEPEVPEARRSRRALRVL